MRLIKYNRSESAYQYNFKILVFRVWIIHASFDSAFQLFKRHTIEDIFKFHFKWNYAYVALPRHIFSDCPANLNCKPQQTKNIYGKEKLEITTRKIQKNQKAHTWAISQASKKCVFKINDQMGKGNNPESLPKGFPKGLAHHLSKNSTLAFGKGPGAGSCSN